MDANVHPGTREGNNYGEYQEWMESYWFAAIKRNYSA